MGKTTEISWTDHRKPGPAPMQPRDGDRKQADGKQVLPHIMGGTARVIIERDQQERRSR